MNGHVRLSLLLIPGYIQRCCSSQRGGWRHTKRARGREGGKGRIQSKYRYHTPFNFIYHYFPQAPGRISLYQDYHSTSLYHIMIVSNPPSSPPPRHIRTSIPFASVTSNPLPTIPKKKRNSPVADCVGTTTVLSCPYPYYPYYPHHKTHLPLPKRFFLSPTLSHHPTPSVQKPDPGHTTRRWTTGKYNIPITLSFCFL